MPKVKGPFRAQFRTMCTERQLDTYNQLAKLEGRDLAEIVRELLDARVIENEAAETSGIRSA